MCSSIVPLFGSVRLPFAIHFSIAARSAGELGGVRGGSIYGEGMQCEGVRGTPYVCPAALITGSSMSSPTRTWDCDTPFAAALDGRDGLAGDGTQQVG